MTAWVDVVARARGLATHLLPSGELHRLLRQPDLGALGEDLRRAGFPVAEGERDPAALEMAVRRRTAQALRLLARWCGPRSDMLAIIFEDEDRRSLRALVRGAAQGAPREARLAGLVPTPALPERSLAELARQASPAGIATLLTAWGHPYGPPLRIPAAAPYPDLLNLDALINRLFALRALAGARRDARRGELVEYVQQAIDLENTVTAVAITGQKDVVPKDLFLPGGKRIDIGVFETAAGRPDGRDAALILAAAFAGAPFAAVLRAARPATEPWEDALLRARVAALRREVRRHPLGPAMALYFALRLRVETTDLSRAIWGIALGAPPHVLAGALLAAP